MLNALVDGFSLTYNNGHIDIYCDEGFLSSVDTVLEAMEGICEYQNELERRDFEERRRRSAYELAEILWELISGNNGVKPKPEHLDKIINYVQGIIERQR